MGWGLGRTKKGGRAFFFTPTPGEESALCYWVPPIARTPPPPGGRSVLHPVVADQAIFPLKRKYNFGSFFKTPNFSCGALRRIFLYRGAPSPLGFLLGNAHPGGGRVLWAGRGGVGHFPAPGGGWGVMHLWHQAPKKAISKNNQSWGKKSVQLGAGEENIFPPWPERGVPLMQIQCSLCNLDLHHVGRLVVK